MYTALGSRYQSNNPSSSNSPTTASVRSPSNSDTPSRTPAKLRPVPFAPEAQQAATPGADNNNTQPTNPVNSIMSLVTDLLPIPSSNSSSSAASSTTNSNSISSPSSASAVTSLRTPLNYNGVDFAPNRHVLLDKIASLELENKNLQASVGEHSRKLSDYTNFQAHYDNQMKQACDEYMKLQGAASQLQSQYQVDMTKTYTNIQQLNSQLINEREKFRVDLQSIESRYQSELKELEEKHKAELAVQKDQHDAALALKKKELDAANNEIKELQKLVAKQGEEIAIWSPEKAWFEARLQKHTLKCDEYERHLAQLSAQITQHKTGQSSAEQRMSTAEKDAREAMSKLAIVEAEHKDMANELLFCRQEIQNKIHYIFVLESNAKKHKEIVRQIKQRMSELNDFTQLGLKDIYTLPVANNAPSPNHAAALAVNWSPPGTAVNSSRPSQAQQQSQPPTTIVINSSRPTQEVQPVPGQADHNQQETVVATG